MHSLRLHHFLPLHKWDRSRLLCCLRHKQLTDSRGIPLVGSARYITNTYVFHLFLYISRKNSEKIYWFSYLILHPRGRQELARFLHVFKTRFFQIFSLNNYMQINALTIEIQNCLPTSCKVWSLAMQFFLPIFH